MMCLGRRNLLFNKGVGDLSVMADRGSSLAPRGNTDKCDLVVHEFDDFRYRYVCNLYEVFCYDPGRVFGKCISILHSFSCVAICDLGEVSLEPDLHALILAADRHSPGMRALARRA